MIDLYPLRFTPIFKSKVWGGNKIKKFIHSNTSVPSNCGESWELVDLPTNESLVKEGIHKGQSIKYLIQKYGELLLGKRVYQKHKNNFPLLIKYIDACADLSIQVHPNDQYLASIGENTSGKSELWYILKKDIGAEIIYGFNQKIDKVEFEASIENKTLISKVQRQKVNIGDAYYIPAGMIHAICKGVFLLEIQQSSDVTYRIYDWDRVDEKGNLRSLHIQESKEALNFNLQGSNRSSNDHFPVETPFFNIDQFNLSETHKIKAYLKKKLINSFVVICVIEGMVEISYKLKNKIEKYIFSTGDIILMPAFIELVDLKKEDHMNGSLLCIDC